MYIAMNRFKIIKGKENDFEKIWKNRKSYLDEVKGFVEFNLVRGNESEDFVLYASHSVWKSEEDFIRWTKSESFRLAHKNAGKQKGIYLDHPIFEGFRVIL